MLITAYLYALYQDKNRKTPFEFFKSSNSKARDIDQSIVDTVNYNPNPTPSGTIKNTNNPDAKQGYSWDKIEDRPYIVAMIVWALFETVMLWFAVNLAWNNSTSKLSLFLNLGSAVMFPAGYVGFHAVVGTSAYYDLTKDEPRGSPKSSIRSSSRLLGSKYI